MIPVAYSNVRVSSEFGEHHGLDFAVPNGTPVLAPVDGTVVTARTMRDADGNYASYGRYVVVRDAQGNDHYLAHLDGYFVAAGQRVTAGTVVGRSGNTGNSSGPHLHYEVRQNGKQVNPRAFIDGLPEGTKMPEGYVPEEDAPRPSSLTPQQESGRADFDTFDISVKVGEVLGLGDDEVRKTNDILLRARDDERRLLEGLKWR